eukprot:GHVU01003583.1.p1 GENE.GHVU01003583.1~~GHVU01003583.1.p1  ORF type:complete len:249 (-),score=14.73 GHVU01003583.1:140-886(-)
MASSTRLGSKKVASTATPSLFSTTNSTVMDENQQSSLVIAPSQQSAPANSLVDDTDLIEGLRAVSKDDFLTFPLPVLEISINQTQERAALVSHDPAKADYKIAYAGNLSLTDFIKASYHLANLTRMQSSGIIPRSLRLNPKVFVYKIATPTTVAVRALQTQYETILLSILIQHHQSTIATASTQFEKSFSEAQVSTNFLLLILGWRHTANKVNLLLTSKRDSLTNMDNRTRNRDRSSTPTRRPRPTNI